VLIGFFIAEPLRKEHPLKVESYLFTAKCAARRAFFSLQADKFDAILSLYDLRQKRIGRRKKE